MLTTDPRPDLIDDTKLWTLILPRAKAISQEALEVLHGLRCLGATLQRIQSGYMLTPAIGPGQFYRTREDWLQDRAKWLVPLQADLQRVLS